MPSPEERLVKPIYDAIDSGQYKHAVQTCTKILKKQPKLDLVKALKALALVRQHKADEASVICEEVLATKPMDELVIGALSHVLRQLNRHEEMVSMFEDAFKKQPQNDEYGAQAFMANVRLGNWKAAQQMANRLYKGFKDERYLYWNVMCIALQIQYPIPDHTTTPSTPSTTPILLALAIRHISSCPNPSTISPDRFFLHLSLLRDQKQYADALKLTRTEVGQVLCNTNLALEELRHGIALMEGECEGELESAKERLVKTGDRNWMTFIKLINCTIELIERDEVLEETRKVLNKLAQEDGSKERGPLLAILELEKRVRAARPSASKPFVPILQTYLTTFSSKMSCYEDLKSYLSLSSSSLDDAPSEIKQWRDFLEGRDLSNASGSVGELNGCINVFKLIRLDLEGEDGGVESEERRAGEYLSAYLKALPLGKHLPKTELQPADDLATLSASAYTTLFTLTHSPSHLHTALTILEYALKHSAHAFHHRLLLIRFYQLIGAPSLALEHYHKLGIKQIQHDSLGHFILARCSTFSLAGLGDLTFMQECQNTSEIYESNTTETPDMVIKAFQHEKYSQIQDFIELEDRLDCSVQRDLTKMEYVRMKFVQELPNTVDVDAELLDLKFLFERASIHHDNRDFTVLPDYQPRGQSINLQTIATGLTQGIPWLHAWMKMYILVLQLASDYDPAIDGERFFGDKLKLFTPAGKERVPLNDRIRTISEEEIQELSPEEQQMRTFVMALVEWLEPHHEYSRPPYKAMPDMSSPILSSTIPSGQPSKVPASSRVKSDVLAPPPTVDLSADAISFFDSMETSFKSAIATQPIWKLLHIATLTQEALVLFNILTARFRPGGGSKVKKNDPLAHSIRDLRERGIAALRKMGTKLIELGEKDATIEGRRAFIQSCSSLENVPEINHDFILDVAKRVTDAQKKSREGLGKGIERICKAHSQGLTFTTDQNPQTKHR